MELAPTGKQDALVRRLLDQGVLEDVLELGFASPLQYEVAGLQAGETVVEGPFGLSQGGEQAIEEAAADDRGQSENLLQLGVKAVDARHDHA